MDTVLITGFAGLLGFACQWLAWRTRQPAILYLLVTGIVIGPVTGYLDPDALFGDVLFSFVSLSVAIILFEGSLTLKKQEVSEVGKTVINMVSHGALLNAVIVTFAAAFFTDLGWSLAALFGAIMVVTGPTVIVPLLRAVRPTVRLSRILRWEGIIIDPLGALFAVLVYEWIIVQHNNAEITQVFIVFLQTILAGIVIGVLFGYILGLLLRHFLIPEYLHNFGAIVFVCSAFVLSNHLMHESGLLAVTVMGIWLANMPNVHTRDILEFKESLTLILVSLLFILLAARLDFGDLQMLGWGALAVFLTMQFVARPAKVWLSTIGSGLSMNERLFLSWVGPRGIVAAAVSALFALRLEQAGYEQAGLLVPLSFTIIIGTVMVQSLTAKPLAKWLGVQQPAARGFLVIGSNPVAITLSKALKEAGAEVVVCDNYWDNIRAARMEGLRTYYGNPMSTHADLHLDTAGLGAMLGLSPDYNRNVAAALRYKDEFGARRVFTLASAMEADSVEKHNVSEVYKGRVLFGDKTTYGKLASALNRGAKIRKTTLSESFGPLEWLEHYKKTRPVPLFFVAPGGQIHLATEDTKIEPESGWTVYALAEDNPPGTPVSKDTPTDNK